MNVSFNITCNNHNHNHKTKSEGKNLTAYLVKNSSNLKCQKVKLQGFGHISVLGRRRVGECSKLQSSCCKSSPGRSKTSDAAGLLAGGFSLFSWRREITRRRRIFCHMPKSATKSLRSKGNHAKSQFAQCNYIKLNELTYYNATGWNPLLWNNNNNNNNNNQILSQGSQLLSTSVSLYCLYCHFHFIINPTLVNVLLFFFLMLTFLTFPEVEQPVQDISPQAEFRMFSFSWRIKLLQGVHPHWSGSSLVNCSF